MTKMMTMHLLTMRYTADCLKGVGREFCMIFVSPPVNTTMPST